MLDFLLIIILSAVPGNAELKNDRPVNLQDNSISVSFGLQSGETNTMQHDIFLLINAHRREAGLGDLQWNSVEADIAAQHSQNMATGKTPFGHAGLKKRVNAIAKQLGTITATGENVASGQITAHDVVEEWLKSPGHRRNIEGDFALTGIGIARDRKGVIFYTQIFTK